MKTSIIILAAGEGSRMRSSLPKSLQPIAGKAMLQHLIDAIIPIDPNQTIIVCSPEHQQQIENAITHDDNKELLFVQQDQPSGTGHAVKCATPEVHTDNIVLVLLGDVPFVSTKTLQKLINSASNQHLALLTASIDNPVGYGRIIRNKHNEITNIVEHEECTEEQAAIVEINSGIMAFPPNKAQHWLTRLSAKNHKGEYYLTDTIGFAAEEGVIIAASQPDFIEEVFGVNTKKQQAEAENIKRNQAADKLMEAGVTLADPKRIDVRGELVCGVDVFIDVNVVFQGKVELLDGVTVGPHSVIANTKIGNNTQILSHCNLEEAIIGDNCVVGPFARLRPGSELMQASKAGNFVEIKKSTIGQGSKVNHLSYVGDATVGSHANIGAGTITCNYDGANKYQTIVGDNAFIGSGVELVAPIEIKEGATIGAGSTITKEAPKNKLTLERAKQKTIETWKRPNKKIKK